MAEETRDDRAGDPIKLLLEEALTRQRNEMMDNFAQILCRLPTTSDASTSSGPSGSAPPSKPQMKKGNGKAKKNTRKWCELHKSPWHNTDECQAK